MVYMRTKCVFRNMQVFDVEFIAMKNTIGIVKAGFAGPERLNFRAAQYHARCIGRLYKVFVVSLFIVDIQSLQNFSKDNTPAAGFLLWLVWGIKKPG